MARTTARDLALSGLPFRGMIVDTASRTLYGSDSGILFVNGAGTDIIYTLPSATDGKGKVFGFFNTVSHKTTITAPSTILYMAGDDNATSAYDNSACGECAFVLGDGTYYYLIEIYGTWSPTA